MSTFLPGLSDYVPQLTPFDPNLNFYANVLGVKQQQYDANLKGLSALYGSVLNSPMQRQDNIARREEYFKSIQQDLQKVAGMDLSLDQNVQSAKTIFDPILKDKYIVSDMLSTKQLGKQFDLGEQYRNCSDPDKCGGEYWNEGMQQLQYWSEEYQKASPDEALAMRPPNFTPYQNVTKKAIAAAKAAGFNMSVDSSTGKYIVTDSNGMLLLGKDGNGVLPQFLYGMFGNDPKVQAMFNTQAYVQRKGFIKNYAAQTGKTEEEAESFYLNNMIPKMTQELHASRADYNNTVQKIDTDLNAATILIKNQGGTAEGDPIEDKYANLTNAKEATKNAGVYQDNVENILKTTSNMNDIRSMRNMVDNVVAQGLLKGTLDHAAYEYAMGSAKQEIKADPYGLAAFNSGLDFNNASRLKAIDHQNELEKQYLLGNINGVYDSSGKLTGYAPGEGTGKNKKSDSAMTNLILEQMQQKGIGWSDLETYGITPENINTPAAHKTLVQQKILTPEQVESVKGTFMNPREMNVMDAYERNAQMSNQTITASFGSAKDFLKATIDSMRDEFGKAKADINGANSVGIRAKILSDLKGVLEGTGLDYNKVITGDFSAQDLNKISDAKMASVANYAGYLQMQDASARVYNSGWSNSKIEKMQIDNQVAAGFLAQRIKNQKAALNNVLATFNVDTAGNPTQVLMEGAAIHSMYGKDGTKLPQGVARENYVRNILNHNAAIPVENIYREFDNLYGKYSKKYNDAMIAVDSKTGSKDQGGGIGQAEHVVFDFNGKFSFAGNNTNVKQIFTGLRNAPDGYTVLGSADKNPDSTLEQGPLRTLADKVIDLVASGNANKMGNSHVELQNVPALQQGQQDYVFTKVQLDEPTARTLLNLKHDAVVDASARTFIIKSYGEGLSGFKNYIAQSTAEPADILLRNDGQQIAVNYPGKGTAVVRRNGGSLWIDYLVNSFDPTTEKWVSNSYKEQVTDPKGELADTKVRDLFDRARQNVNQYYQEHGQSVYQEFLRRQSEHAKRTTKS